MFFEDVGDGVLDVVVVIFLAQHFRIARKRRLAVPDEVERIQNELLVRLREQRQKGGRNGPVFDLLAQKIGHGNVLQDVFLERFGERFVGHRRKIRARRLPVQFLERGIAEAHILCRDLVFPLLLGT